MGFCSAIVTATVIHVFNQAFYAIGKNWFPLIAGAIGLVVNPVICYILIGMGVGPLSLSLAYSFTNICQMIMLSIAYCRQKDIAPHGIFKFLLKSMVCVAVMAGIVYLVNLFVPAQGGKISQLLIVAAKGIIAIVVYFVMASILRMEEATEWINKFKTKVLKKSNSKKKVS